MAIRVVEVPRSFVEGPRTSSLPALPRDLTSAELALQALDDPDALEMLLEALTARAKAKKLDRKLRAQCLELARVLLPHASRY